MELTDLNLFPYQLELVKEGQAIINDERVCLFACEPRTGKTRIALALSSLYLGDKPLLVITKKNAIPGWIEDLDDVGLKDEIDMTVVNFESLHKVPYKDWGLIIVDECHSISGFPKAANAHVIIKGLCKGKRVILLSATPSIESICQMYHTLDIVGYWEETNFYHWHKHYGIPDQVNINGRWVETYKKAMFEDVMAKVEYIRLSLTQEEAGFTQKAKVIHHRIDNPALRNILKRFKHDKVMQVGGQIIVAKGAAGVLQKCHMIAGGTAKDDGFGDPAKAKPVFLSSYKAKYLAQKFLSVRKGVILTEYIAERELIKRELGIRVTQDINKFKNTDIQFFLGGTRSWAEGVDFSYCSDLIIYSLTWSGTKYTQVLSRLCKQTKQEECPVHILTAAGTVDEKVFEAVSNKMDFNLRFYEGVSAA